MQWTPEQLAHATGGAVTDAAWATHAGPVTTDSRRVAVGGVFVPIVAERDGHAFVAAAVDAGAAAFLYEPSRLPDPQGAAAVAVADTRAALLDLGRAARSRLGGAVVVGITGSVGKTSTKDLTVAAVSAGRRAVGNVASFNNELGVPLTLANAPEDAEVVAVEMGARGIGHISLLCGVARPSVAVVTAVAGVHTEVFGSIEEVAVGKGELVEALPADGLAVLNGEDRRVAAMAARTDAAVVRYGVGGDFDVVAEDVHLDDSLRARFTLRSPWGAAPVALSVRGEHQVGNALAALAVAGHAGVDLAAAADAVGRAGVSRWRMEVSTTPSGPTVINDAYNANPVSVAAALRALAHLPVEGRRVAVLGAMAELGPEGAAEHRRMASLADGLGIEVLAVGTDAYGDVRRVAGIDEAAAALVGLGRSDAVLVKASRVAGLERLAAALIDR